MINTIVAILMAIAAWALFLLVPSSQIFVIWALLSLLPISFIGCFAAVIYALVSKD